MPVSRRPRPAVVLARAGRREVRHAGEPIRFPGQEPADVEIGVCVSDIQRRSGLGQSTTSQYLAILRQAGLVVATRRGKWTYYRRDEANIARLLETLGDVFQPLAVPFGHRGMDGSWPAAHRILAVRSPPRQDGSP
ncbi:regulatory protein, arsR family [Streptomyces sp. Termitarium-T10T-6]|nr:regulatory protein, arsR family [Streptomyces sp. Termitarium-T10T-6]